MQADREHQDARHVVRPAQAESRELLWTREAALRADGPLVSLTATVPVTTAVVSALTQL